MAGRVALRITTLRRVEGRYPRTAPCGYRLRTTKHKLASNGDNAGQPWIRNQSQHLRVAGRQPRAPGYVSVVAGGRWSVCRGFHSRLAGPRPQKGCSRATATAQ